MASKRTGRSLLGVALWAVNLSIIVACGGNSAVGSNAGISNGTIADGVYAGFYSGGGSIVIAKYSNGNLNIAVNDPTNGQLAGTGSITGSSTNFTGQASSQASVSLTGDFNDHSLDKTFSAKTSGAFTTSASGTWQVAPDVSLFTGSYTVHATDSAGHAFSFPIKVAYSVIGTSAAVTGTWKAPNGDVVPVTGQVSDVGVATFKAKDNSTGDYVECDGGFAPASGGGATGSGPAIKSSSGVGGAWTAARP